jgi:hypothetical protein
MCFEIFFAECKETLGKEALRQVFFLPSVFLALGKELLCRVPEKKHSANHLHSQRAGFR